MGVIYAFEIANVYGHRDLVRRRKSRVYRGVLYLALFYICCTFKSTLVMSFSER